MIICLRDHPQYVHRFLSIPSTNGIIIIKLYLYYDVYTWVVYVLFSHPPLLLHSAAAIAVIALYLYVHYALTIYFFYPHIIVFMCR